MNQITKYLISIDRYPYLNGRKIAQAMNCQSYGSPAWAIAFFGGGYTLQRNPVFTDEDGLNEASTIEEFANNLGFGVEE